MNKIARYGLLIFFFCAVVPFAVYGVWRQWDNAKNVSPVIIEDVIKPYAALIQNAEWDTAYEEFTSARYKSQYSFDQYKAVQMENVEVYGSLLRIDEGLGLMEETFVPDKGWFYRMRFDYEGTQRSELISFDFVEEDGSIRIDQSYEVTGTGVSNVSNDGNIRVPRIY